MREQDKFKIDRFRSRSLEKELPAGDPAGVGGIGDQQAATAMPAPLAVRRGRLGRLVARIAAYSAGSLLLAAVMLAAPAASSAEVSIGVSVTLAPPALPVYVQPLCPGPGFMWMPGYWAWDPDSGYYWVPGTWVLAPFPGALWTPSYWAWNDGVFVWHTGYWGPVVGFYGGINYGFGYTGYGYAGGYWQHGAFYYNRSVNNVSVTNITNVYNKTVINNVTATRVSYNGGAGGTTVRPTAAQLAAAREQHSPPTEEQRRHERVARADPRLQAAVNHGRPAVAATPKPGVLTGRGVVRASRAGAPYKAEPLSRAAGPGAPARTSHPAGAERRASVTAPEHAAPHARPARPAAPRNEPAQRAYRPGELRPAPERPGAVRQPGARRAGPQRPDKHKQPPKGGTKREEGGPH
jgi:hypothetical protein